MPSEQELICINCPMGCRMKAVVENGEVVRVTGFACRRGEAYAKEEVVHPKRMVTALARIAGRRQPLPVKTDRPIERELIFEALAALHQVTLEPPVQTGDVVLANVCGTQVNFVATADA